MSIISTYKQSISVLAHNPICLIVPSMAQFYVVKPMEITSGLSSWSAAQGVAYSLDSTAITVRGCPRGCDSDARTRGTRASSCRNGTAARPSRVVVRFLCQTLQTLQSVQTQETLHYTHYKHCKQYRHYQRNKHYKFYKRKQRLRTLRALQSL